VRQRELPEGDCLRPAGAGQRKSGPTDLATVGSFSATVNWGDGSISAGEVEALDDGTFLVRANHAHTR
jgi:hypothetical protein